MNSGLGKTLQIITLARYRKLHMGLKHCLIICGINSLKFNWEREVAKFCKDEKAIVLGTRVNRNGRIVSITSEETKAQIDSCPEEFFWIINVEKIRLTEKDKKNKTGIVNHFNKLIEAGELGMIAIDEIHKAKSITSSTATGLLELNPKASKVGMTGTLLVNNPIDLYCPMRFIGLIDYGRWSYDRKYVVRNDWGQPIGYQNMDELHDILYKSSLRRTKDLLELPPKIYKQEWLEFSDDEWKVMNDLTQMEYNGRYLNKIDPITEPIALVTRMRQATVDCNLITSTKVMSTKFSRLNDILEEARANGQKVLVFCPFTEALKHGLEYCKEYKPKLVCGGMGDLVQKTIDEHENTQGFSVIFAQESTLGVGFTLTNTSIVVFLSPPWNKATYDQCSDRAHRIGQKNTVQIIDLYIKDTYDEVVYDKLHGKGAMANIVIDGKQGSELVEALNYINKMGIAFS